MRILIIGGTGSLGERLTEHYTNGGHDVSILSRDSVRQSKLRLKYPQVENFYLGDICDYNVVEPACRDQDVVINTAALKVVSLGEDYPIEFTRVNTLGSEVVARACFENGVPVSLLISSDKATSPVNVYGATKMIAERIYTNFGYTVLRYGNIAESNGSVLHVWKHLISKNKPIKLRLPSPTRFFLTITDAIALIDDVVDRATGGDIYIPHSLKSFSLESLALFMNGKIEHENLLPGEKQHEILLSPHEQGMIVSDLLALIKKGYVGGLDHSMFSSENAPMMTPEEVLERAGIEI